MREHSVRSHTGVEVTDDVSLLSRFIEITYMQQTFLALIPMKLRVYEGLRGYARVCEGIRRCTRVCEDMGGYTVVYEGIRGCTKVYEGMRDYAKV